MVKKSTAKEEFNKLWSEVPGTSEENEALLIETAIHLIRGINSSKTLKKAIFKVNFWHEKNKEKTLFYKLVPGEDIVKALEENGNEDGILFNLDLAELN